VEFKETPGEQQPNDKFHSRERRETMSRISKERMDKALEQLKTISDEDYAKVKGLASIVKPLRSVLHKTPDDYGMTGWQLALEEGGYGDAVTPSPMT
jgi:hypothetical protein